MTSVRYSFGASATSPTSASLDITVGGTTCSVGLTSTNFAGAPGHHLWIGSDGGSDTVVLIATSDTVSSAPVYSYSGVSDQGDAVLQAAR